MCWKVWRLGRPGWGDSAIEDEKPKWKSHDTWTLDSELNRLFFFWMDIGLNWYPPLRTLRTLTGEQAVGVEESGFCVFFFLMFFLPTKTYMFLSPHLSQKLLLLSKSRSLSQLYCCVQLERPLNRSCFTGYYWFCLLMFAISITTPACSIYAVSVFTWIWI